MASRRQSTDAPVKAAIYARVSSDDDDPELREMRSIQTAVALTWAALERQKISRRTKAGLERARRQGKRLGRKPVEATPAQLSRLLTKGLSMAEIATKLHVSRRTAYRLRDRIPPG